MQNGFSAGLARVEFARIYFHLEFQEPFSIHPGMLLRLRRGLRRAGREALPAGDADGSAGGAFARLFDPDLSSDPVSVKRYQRPGPPFAIQPDRAAAGSYEVGERFVLPVNFIGCGIQGIGDFAKTLRVLGRHGLYQGMGLFDLVAIEAEDASSSRLSLWTEGKPPGEMALPLIDLQWWLEGRLAGGLTRGMTFLTPARLVSRGKPLFRASFARLFPFALRRVTSMLYAHCGFEFEDAPELAAMAGSVAVASNRLRWVDWRVLDGDEGAQELGGVGGSLHFADELPVELFQVLALASLMNLGKGAAFGSGYFHLEGD